MKLTSEQRAKLKIDTPVSEQIYGDGVGISDNVVGKLWLCVGEVLN